MTVLLDLAPCGSSSQSSPWVAAVSRASSLRRSRCGFALSVDAKTHWCAPSSQARVLERRSVLLAVDPGIAYVHPGILVFLQAHAAGDGRRHVDPGRVEDLPAELVLAVVEVPVVGGLRLRLATRKALELLAMLPPCPVVIVDVPGSGLLDPRPHPGPATCPPDANARPVAELEPAVRYGDLTPGIPYVLRGEDFAPFAAAVVGGGRVDLRGGRRVIGGGGVLNLLLPLLVYPTLQAGALPLWQDGLDSPLRSRYGRGDPLVVVGGRDLLRYLLFGETLVRGEQTLALLKLLRQDPVLAAGRGEDVSDLAAREAETGLELLDVLLLGEDDGDGGLLGVRVRGVLPGLDGDTVSHQQDQDRNQREKPERRSPATSVPRR